MTTITHPAKHSGFIAAVAAQPLINDIVANLYKKYTHIEDYLWADSSCQQLIVIKDRTHFWNQLQSNLYFGQRNQLEKNFNFRQLLPYVLVLRRVPASTRYPLGVQVKPYARMSGGGEARLHNKYSVGFGGHIDLADVIYDDNQADPESGLDANRPNILETVGQNAYREVVNEELHFTYPSPTTEENAVEIDFIDLILLETQEETGRVHLGLVHTMILPEGSDVTSPEAEQIELQDWASFTELKNSGHDFEGWSRALVEYYAEKERHVESLNDTKPGNVLNDVAGESELPRSYGGSGGGISE